MFKVNNKETRTMSLKSYFAPFSVSIVDFEQVKACWEFKPLSVQTFQAILQCLRNLENVGKQ